MDGVTIGGGTSIVNIGLAAGILTNDAHTSDTTELTGSDQILNVISCTQAEYDGHTPVATTLYIITGV